MSIFNLHSGVLADYRDFVRSLFTVDDDRARHLPDEPARQLAVGSILSLSQDRVLSAPALIARKE